MFASDIRGNQINRMRSYSNLQWHLDGVFVKINGETRYVWFAVDHGADVQEAHVTKRRDCEAALKFLRKSMKLYGSVYAIVTEKLRSYCGAIRGVATLVTRNWPLAEQSDGEFSSPVSTTRTAHAPFHANAKSAKINRRSYFRP